ncbi:hypothetical protein G5V59_18080 [Nocardioides sp. W3-2-3]|nr:hypothetical protein [Nocardioides convexus]
MTSPSSGPAQPASRPPRPWAACTSAPSCSAPTATATTRPATCTTSSATTAPRPPSLRTAARKDAEAYADVTFRDAEVLSISGSLGDLVLEPGRRGAGPGPPRAARHRRPGHPARDPGHRRELRRPGGALPLLPRPRVRRHPGRHPRLRPARGRDGLDARPDRRRAWSCSPTAPTWTRRSEPRWPGSACRCSPTASARSAARGTGWSSTSPTVRPPCSAGCW